MKKWLEQCPEELKLVYHRRYVDGIFVLFRSHDHLNKFRDYLNKCHPNIKFSFVEEKTNFHNELAFLKDIFNKNGYPISSRDKCFKTLLDWVYLKRTQVLTAEKKTLSLFFPFLENCPFKPGQNFKKFSKEH